MKKRKVWRVVYSIRQQAYIVEVLVRGEWQQVGPAYKYKTDATRSAGFWYGEQWQ